MPTDLQLQLEESTSNSSRVQMLEKEVKEKELLIQKLRHEGALVFQSLVLLVMSAIQPS